MIAAPCKGRSSSGPRLCRTPVRSPQSDRISGASAQTLKRDHACCQFCRIAETVVALLPGWLEEGDDVQPQPGSEVPLAGA
jgi:putative transposase